MITQAYVFAKDSKHVWTFASYDEMLQYFPIEMFSQNV